VTSAGQKYQSRERSSMTMHTVTLVHSAKRRNNTARPVPWLTRFVVGLAPHGLEFDLRPLQVGFVWEKVPMGNVFSCQYQSTNALYSFTRWQPMPCNFSSSQCCYMRDVTILTTVRARGTSPVIFLGTSAVWRLSFWVQLDFSYFLVTLMCDFLRRIFLPVIQFPF